MGDPGDGTKMESIVNEIIVAAGINCSSERIRIAVKCMYSSISNM